MAQIRTNNGVPVDIEYPHVLTRWISTSSLLAAELGDTVDATLGWADHRDIDIIPVVETGRTIRTYLVREDLRDYPGTRFTHELPRHNIGLDELVAADSHVADALDVLARRPWVFTFERSCVVGIMTRGDLQHPLARMSFFGILTQLELEVSRILRAVWPEDEWMTYDNVDEKLKRRAQSEWKKRSVSNEEPMRVSDCLNLPDKLQLFSLTEPWRTRIRQLVASHGLTADGRGGFPDALRQLRNNVAHAWDLTQNVDGRWATVLAVVALVQDVTRDVTLHQGGSSPM